MKMDPFQSLYYVSPACLVCLVVPFFIVELPGIRSLLASPLWTFRPSVFLANAFTAFLLNLAVFMLIGKTSALTMNIAGVIKDWTLIYSSYSVFKAPVTTLNLTGVRLCCSCGVILCVCDFLLTGRSSTPPTRCSWRRSRRSTSPVCASAVLCCSLLLLLLFFSECGFRCHHMHRTHLTENGTRRLRVLLLRRLCVPVHQVPRGEQEGRDRDG